MNLLQKSISMHKNVKKMSWTDFASIKILSSINLNLVNVYNINCFSLEAPDFWKKQTPARTWRPSRATCGSGWPSSRRSCNGSLRTSLRRLTSKSRPRGYPKITSQARQRVEEVPSFMTTNHQKLLRSKTLVNHVFVLLLNDGSSSNFYQKVVWKN